MRNIAFITVIGAALLSAGSGIAFPFLHSWHEPSTANRPAGRGGGGDIYGTGSVQDWGIQCSHCHIESEGKIGVQITASPQWKQVGGEDAYVPGQRYDITVRLTGEHLGLNNTDKNGAPVPDDNLNGMVAVIENAAGKTAGVYFTDSGVNSNNCPTVSPDKNDASLRSTYVYGDCHGVLFTEAARQTTWSFAWQAPAAGAGELTLYYGVVDGNHHASSCLDDDVKEGTLKLLEGN